METGPQGNVDLLLRAVEHLNRREIDRCTALLTTGFVINIAEMPYPKTGRKAWREHAEALFTAFPDAHVDVEDLVAGEDKVAIRARIRGTHTGQFIGLPPTGHAVDYVSHEVYRFEAGAIAEEWICSDTVTLMTQVGALDRGRIVAAWLAGYRFWAGAAAGAALGVLAGRFFT